MDKSPVAPRSTASPAQIEANRQNARRSTGPRTPEGKRKSSTNAIKHGLSAQNIVVPRGDCRESAAEFVAFRAELYKMLKPREGQEAFSSNALWCVCGEKSGRNAAR